MSLVLASGAPLEEPAHPIGHVSTSLTDAARGDRRLALECWYPAAAVETDPAVYEVVPGIGFSAAARTAAPPAPGPHPLVLFSHGRSGARTSYVLLCEGLAARGYVVVAPDHPGDTLVDWMLGTAVDDATNEAQRVADVRFVLDALLADDTIAPPLAHVDHTRIAVAGHSYGGYTALAFAGAHHADPRVRAVAGLQPFTRSLSRKVIARIAAPTLLVAAARDETCPPAIDTDRAWAVLSDRDARRVDVEAAGHQASSDVGLYLELRHHVEGLPEIVSEFLGSMAAQITGTAGDPWRPTVGLHLSLLGGWLDETLAVDAARAARDLATARTTPGVTLVGTRA
jgi:predicted dienelactone hydrolase